MIKVNVIVKNNAWKKYIKNPNLYLEKKVKILSKKIPLFKRGKFHLSLLLAGNSEIHKLNKKFKRKDKSTDILSFPFYKNFLLKEIIKKGNKDIYLGDIIINLNKMISKTNEKDFLLNFDKIWIHGLAHLFGYRHKSNIDFSIMKKIETKLIKHSK